MTEQPERTHCVLCGHLNTLHNDEPDGTRPCRSIGHPKGLTCRECMRLTSAEHVDAIMRMREEEDPAFEEAWASYRVTLDHVRNEIGEGWQAFFTDVHQAALASALIAYRKHTSTDRSTP